MKYGRNVMASEAVYFDHIEVHVKDIPKYCTFLKMIFKGGRAKVISPSGTSIFISNDGLCIEIKKNDTPVRPNKAGFCLPCLRMKSAKVFIEKTLKLKIEKVVTNPDGKVYFFSDHE